MVGGGELVVDCGPSVVGRMVVIAIVVASVVHQISVIAYRDSS